MATRGLDALFCHRPSNMRGWRAYDGWSFYVASGRAASPRGPALVWWDGRDGQSGAQRTTYLEDDIRGYDGGHLCPEPDKHRWRIWPPDSPPAGLENARIRVELDINYFTASAFLDAAKPRYRASTSRRHRAGCDWQRAVKSPPELEYMRRAARIVERCHEVIREKGRSRHAQQEKRI